MEGQSNRIVWARDAKEHFTEKMRLKLSLKQWGKNIQRAFLVRGTE